MSTKAFAVGALVAVAALTQCAFSNIAAAQAGHDRENQSQSHGRQPSSRAEPRSRVPNSAPDWAVRYPPTGRSFHVLPERAENIHVGRDDYRYYSGVFYRPQRSGTYIVVRAPYGARVRHLPIGYVSFLLGSQLYFYANFTYYLWDPRATEYIVVAPPTGGEAAVEEASKQGSSELFVYPKEGQSDEQRDRDRYECYLWAADQTGFDPVAESPSPDKAGDYRRAMSACLEGRGYTVK